MSGKPTPSPPKAPPGISARFKPCFKHKHENGQRPFPTEEKQPATGHRAPLATRNRPIRSTHLPTGRPPRSVTGVPVLSFLEQPSHGDTTPLTTMTL